MRSNHFFPCPSCWIDTWDHWDLSIFWQYFSWFPLFFAYCLIFSNNFNVFFGSHHVCCVVPLKVWKFGATARPAPSLALIWPQTSVAGRIFPRICWCLCENNGCPVKEEDFEHDQMIRFFPRSMKEFELQNSAMNHESPALVLLCSVACTKRLRGFFALYERLFVHVRSKVCFQIRGTWSQSSLSHSLSLYPIVAHLCSACLIRDESTNPLVSVALHHFFQAWLPAVTKFECAAARLKIGYPIQQHPSRIAIFWGPKSPFQHNDLRF